MRRFTPWESLAVAAAPLSAAASMMIGRVHLIASPDLQDFVQGVVMGAGVGLSIGAFIRSRMRPCRAKS